MAKRYLDGIKHRGVNPGHEILQVVTGPIELKTSESRQDLVRWQRRASTINVGKKQGVFKVNVKRFEVGQHDQVRDDHLG